MLIHKMHDSLTILLEFIIIEQEDSQLFIEDDHFSFKKIVNYCLPETKQRSKIIQNFSYDHVIDFHISNDIQFNFTTNGLYKSTNGLNFEKIEFKIDKNIEIIELLKKVAIHIQKFHIWTKNCA